MEKLSKMIILTGDEVQSIIKSCLNIRDEVIISVLYDTAIRVTELVALDICDVVKKDDGWTITVGYTRMDKNIRPIALTSSSAPFMSEYIKYLGKYLVKNQGKEPLFLSTIHIGRISIREVNDIVRSAAERAGIEKVTPYVFRHSRLTRR